MNKEECGKKETRKSKKRVWGEKSSLVLVKLNLRGLQKIGPKDPSKYRMADLGLE